MFTHICGPFVHTLPPPRISDLGVGYNHHGNTWSGTAAHAGQCSGSTTLASDSTFSDGHLAGLSYHNDADCTWVLDSGTPTDITTLSLSFLDIQAGWDTITVREGADGTGDILAVYSGMQSPPPLTVVGSLHVHFASDGKNQIFAEDQEAGFTAAVAFTTGSVAACPEGKYGGDCSSNYCYGKTTMTGSGNVVTEHRNSAHCYWDLTATSADQVVDLKFSAFAFEYSNDYIEVYDVNDAGAETLIGQFTGFTLPPRLISSGQTMRIKLVADEVVWEGQGFTAAFASITAPAAQVCNPGSFGPYCDVR